MMKLLLLTLASVVLLFVVLRWSALKRLDTQKKTVGFFHPFCASGGGGERVLWQMVRFVQEAHPSWLVVIYTGDTEAGTDILRKAEERFNLKGLGASQIRFVRLKSRGWLLATSYPRFTLLGQSLGSIRVVWEALHNLTPHVFVDTTGYAFTLPIARLLFGCVACCYTHYPTISTDMLQRVASRRPSHNNDARVAGNVMASRAKLVYYHAFAALYSLVGRFSALTMVNSSWTAGHIRSLWKQPVVVVFPPCDTATLQTLPLDQREAGLVISLGQFRPEKDHMLQVEAFALFKKHNPDVKARLVMIGGVRDAGDQARVLQLQQRVQHLGLQDFVRFETNVPFTALQEWLAKAQAGLHTMWNEHFGIGIVEFMAAGVIPVAHNSGGPKADIVVPYEGQATGYLASTPEGYASALTALFQQDASSLHRMQCAGRARAAAFSDEAFATSLRLCFNPLLNRLSS